MSGIKDSSSTASGEETKNSDMEEIGFNRRLPDQGNWWKIPRRYQVALMCCLAFFIRGWISTNLWMALYHIILLPEEERLLNFPKIENLTVSDIEWMINVNYWGSAAIQIPAAALVISFSPHKIMLLTILLSSFVHMLIPFVIHEEHEWLILIVFIQGMTTGPLACACIGMWREWAPTTERTRLLVLSFCGSTISIYITFALDNYLANEIGPISGYNFAGVAGLIWCLLWNTLIYDTPVTDPLITVNELCYLEGSIPSYNTEKVPLRSIPVLSILTSIPVLVLGLIFFTITILKKVMVLSHILLNIDILTAGYEIFWIPWVQVGIYFLVIPTCGFFVDFLINRKKFETIVMRKTLCCGAIVIHVGFLFLSFIPNLSTSGLCFMCSFIFLSLTIAGYIPNIVDLSPRYGCILIALGSIVSRIADMVFDTILEWIESEDVAHANWKDMFIPCGVFGLVTAVAYALFASSDEQPWSIMTIQRRPVDSRCYPQSETQDGETLVSERL